MRGRCSTAPTTPAEPGSPPEGGTTGRIEDALTDAAYDRTVVQTAFRSDIEDPASVAARVVAWATD